MLFCLCAHKHWYTCMLVHVRMCTNAHLCMGICVCVCVHAFVCLCVRVSICACVCVPLKHASVHSSVYAHVCKAYDFTPVYVYVCVSFNKRFPITATVSECLIL